MKQIIAVTVLNLRNIPSRLGTSLVIVVGIAGVVGVLIAMMSMSKASRGPCKAPAATAAR
jgi:putative ABC transport system permease protein